jgi:hypothetical protein
MHNPTHNTFLNYEEAIKVNHPWFDRTYDGTTGGTYYATRLTGGNTNAIYGLAKSISVMPGDVIRTEVFAKYIDTNNGNWTAALTDLMTSIANGTAPAGTVIDGGAPGSLGNGTFPHTGVLTRNNDNGTGPKAYLNYIVFDRNITVASGGFPTHRAKPVQTWPTNV